MFYSQRDSRWASQRLNSTAFTIETAGSKLVSLCSAASHADTMQISPKQLHAMCLLRGNCFLRHHVDVEKTCELLGLHCSKVLASDLTRMRANLIGHLKEHHMALLTVQRHMHGVEHVLLAISNNAGAIVCADPWSGELCTLSERGLEGKCGTHHFRQYAVVAVQGVWNPFEDITQPNVKRVH